MEILDEYTEFEDCYETSYFGKGSCQGIWITLIDRIEFRNVKMMSDVIEIVCGVISTKVIRARRLKTLYFFNNVAHAPCPHSLIALIICYCELIILS